MQFLDLGSFLVVYIQVQHTHLRRNSPPLPDTIYMALSGITPF